MDAQAAVDALAGQAQQEQQQQSGSSCDSHPETAAMLAMAYLRLGDAFMAEREHPDRECSKALEVQPLHFPADQACCFKCGTECNTTCNIDLNDIGHLKEQL